MPETFTREITFDHVKHPLVIHQQTPSDVGGVVWDGALVLASFISKYVGVVVVVVALHITIILLVNQ